MILMSHRESVCASSHFSCSGGVVVLPVEVVLVRPRPAREHDVHIQIVLWFFSTGPVLCYCLVHYHGSLDREKKE